MAAKKAVKKTAAKKAAKKPAKKAAKKAKKPLTLKQEVFVEEYMSNGGNGVKAAKAAGYKGNTNTLNQVARSNLQKPTIQEYRRERLKGVKANSDELFFLLSDHLRADLADIDECMNEEGMIDLKKAKRIGVSHLVKKIRIRIGKGGTKTTEVEIHDSQSAAGKLAKLMGLEQQPKANDDDVARVRAELAKLVSEGWEPEEARSIVIEAEPAAARWLH